MDAPSTILRWPFLALPCVTVAGHFPMKPGHGHLRYVSRSVALHRHHYSCRMTLGRRVLDILPGDVTLTPAGTVSTYDLSAEGHHLCIHFAPCPSRRVPCALLPTHLRLGEQEALVAESFQRIIRLHRLSSGGPSARQKLLAAAASAALQDLLLGLAVRRIGFDEGRPQAASRAALERARVILDQRFREQLSAATLALDTGLSTNHFGRLFRRHFGMTVRRYILQRRIELAEQLLQTTVLPAKAVGTEAGISDPQYFNKQFRRATGLSPSAFRRRATAD